jgi:hypothetical protein
MSNPAAALLDIFNSWAEVSIAASQRPGLGTPEMSGEIQHIHALELVREIWQQLDVLEAEGIDVDVFREASAKWVHIVLAYPRTWGSAAEHGALFKEGRLDILQALIAVLSGRRSTINLAAAPGIGDFLDGIMTLLAEDDALDDALRAYIVKLVSEVRRASDLYKATGEFNAEDALTQLWVALLAAEGQSAKKKSRWKDFAEQMKVPVASGLLVGLPTLAIEALKLATATQ